MPNIEIPEAHSFLLTEHWRYKFLKGGRGSMKSWSAADALLVKGAGAPHRFLCCREIQKSLKDSVHQLLKDRIQAFNLDRFYEVNTNGVRGKNGTQFGFEGLHHNIMNIKSWEGADIAWVEEAQVVSKNSWNILIPTIRKEGSEIWGTYNPELEEDETHQRFAINTPPNCKVVHTTYLDNPWLSDTLRDEAEYMRIHDPVGYRHIWLGECRQAIEGAVFEQQLRKTAEEGRITTVPYDPVKPVNTYWDLGRNDKTAVWFMQSIGGQFRFIDYYEYSKVHFSHYIKILKELPYAYGHHYLPHDASHELLGQEKSILNQMRAAFSGVEEPIARTSKKALSIDAARSIFPNAWFDKDKCADGLTCLRRYAYKVDPDTRKTSPEPEHDTPWSHGADAFQTCGMAAQLTEKKKKTGKKVSIYRGQ